MSCAESSAQRSPARTGHGHLVPIVPSTLDTAAPYVSVEDLRAMHALAEYDAKLASQALSATSPRPALRSVAYTTQGSVEAVPLGREEECPARRVPHKAGTPTKPTRNGRTQDSVGQSASNLEQSQLGTAQALVTQLLSPPSQQELEARLKVHHERATARIEQDPDRARQAQLRTAAQTLDF